MIGGVNRGGPNKQNERIEPPDGSMDEEDSHVFSKHGRGGAGRLGEGIRASVVSLSVLGTAFGADPPAAGARRDAAPQRPAAPPAGTSSMRPAGATMRLLATLPRADAGDDLIGLVGRRVTLNGRSSTPAGRIGFRWIQ